MVWQPDIVLENKCEEGAQAGQGSQDKGASGKETGEQRVQLGPLRTPGHGGLVGALEPAALIQPPTPRPPRAGPPSGCSPRYRGYKDSSLGGTGQAGSLTTIGRCCHDPYGGELC